MARRFGLVLPIQQQGGDLGALLAELREEVRAAERAGSDAFFFPEFHQARGGAIVSPLLAQPGSSPERSASVPERWYWLGRYTTPCAWLRTR